ncbi:hypothetical protein, partial [Paramuribaculum intestinale]|uniref:hypothetical protein n=1 Tax=Paramuribaculum intestinale TaxID=2094151 RepID=UPI0027295F6A
SEIPPITPNLPKKIPKTSGTNALTNTLWERTLYDPTQAGTETYTDVIPRYVMLHVHLQFHKAPKKK